MLLNALYMVICVLSVSLMLIEGNESMMCSESVQNRVQYLDSMVKKEFPGFMENFTANSLLPVVGEKGKNINTLMRSFASDQATNLMFFGGSMLAGRNCQEFDELPMLCAYPNRMKKMMQFIFHKHFPKESKRHYDNALKVSINSQHEDFEGDVVNIFNQAQGGTNTDSTLPILPVLLSKVSKPSAIFFDFSYNDKGLDIQKIGMATEITLRYIRSHFPTTAIFLNEVSCDMNPKHIQIKRRLAALYGVTVLSYRESVFDCTDEQYWQGPHGPFQVLFCVFCYYLCLFMFNICGRFNDWSLTL